MEYKNLAQELDDVYITAEIMANAMARIAPFNQRYR